MRINPDRFFRALPEWQETTIGNLKETCQYFIAVRGFDAWNR